jgi:Ras-related protein Rab-1A
MEDYKFLFKVVMIGEAGVGKTCLVRRFYQGVFPIGQAATIGVDFLIKTLEINGDKIKVSILFLKSGSKLNNQLNVQL